MPVTGLFLVRHGETKSNRERRYLGLLDDVLTDLGFFQAEQLADALVLFPIVAIYSSPLQRAYYTALPIAARHSLEVRVLDSLRECDFGLWDGLTNAEIEARGQREAELLGAWRYDTTLGTAPLGGG